MAAKTSKFMIGIFATIGVVLAVVTMVWLGASKYFQKGTILSPILMNPCRVFL